MGIETDVREIKRTLAKLVSQSGKSPVKKAKSRPKFSVKQGRQRTARILQDVARSRRVSAEQLSGIAQRHGMVRAATGTLYAGGYVKKGKDGKIMLTEKGRAFKV